MFRSLILLCLVGVGSVTAASTVQLSADGDPATTVNVVLSVFPDSTTPAVARADIEDGAGGTAGTDCQFVYTSGMGLDDRNLPSVLLTVDMTQSPPKFTGAQAACDITGTTGASFSFIFRLRKELTVDSAEDLRYTISYNGLKISGQILTGVSVLNVADVRAATVSTYIIALSVTDDMGTDQTDLAIGDTAHLKLTMRIGPFRLGLDYAGARVHTCSMASDAAFTEDIHELIDADGCSTGNALFYNIDDDMGFDRDDVDSTNNPPGKTFVAITPGFEIGAYTKVETTLTNTIYFKCCLTPCMDDGDSGTAGQCGADHCQPTLRRKRDASNDTDTVVTGSVTLLPKDTNTTSEQPQDDLCACPESIVLFGSMGGLGIVAAIMFGMAVIAYMDLQRTALRLSEGRTASKSKESNRSSAMAPQPVSISGGKSYYA